MSALNQTDESQEEIAVLTVDELRRLLDAQNKRGYSNFQDYVIINLLQTHSCVSAKRCHLQLTILIFQ
ncbi:hypothetical protein [Bacillus cereus]|uniref:hypothetical protein n=1 Tax=Bacillus cereus TaxID=1396 RepID=UPI00211D435A|nr:hypothetical protein [Bacillus cereus]